MSAVKHNATKNKEDNIFGEEKPAPPPPPVRNPFQMGVGSVVQFHRDPTCQPPAIYAAIVTNVKRNNETVDLYVISPTGQTQFYYDIPRRSERQQQGVWDVPDWWRETLI